MNFDGCLSALRRSPIVLVLMLAGCWRTMITDINAPRNESTFQRGQYEKYEVRLIERMPDGSARSVKMKVDRLAYPKLVGRATEIETATPTGEWRPTELPAGKEQTIVDLANVQRLE